MTPTERLRRRWSGALGHAPNTARLAQQYLSGLAWSGAPGLWLWSSGASCRHQPTRAGPLGPIAGHPVNAMLAYLLIYGKLGLPQLELLGAGLATTFVSCTTFLVGLWFATIHVLFAMTKCLIPLALRLALDAAADRDRVSDIGCFSDGVRNFGLPAHFWRARLVLAQHLAHQVAFEVAINRVQYPAGITRWLPCALATR